jgi:hypothetical protein
MRIRHSLALGLAKQRLFKEAGENFRKVLVVDPLYAGARIGLGKALLTRENIGRGFKNAGKLWMPGNSVIYLKKIWIQPLKYLFGSTKSASQDKLHQQIMFPRCFLAECKKRGS